MQIIEPISRTFDNIISILKYSCDRNQSIYAHLGRQYFHHTDKRNRHNADVSHAEENAHAQQWHKNEHKRCWRFVEHRKQRQGHCV